MISVAKLAAGEKRISAKAKESARALKLYQQARAA
jgi:hypothetical protein